MKVYDTSIFLTNTLFLVIFKDADGKQRRSPNYEIRGDKTYVRDIVAGWTKRPKYKALTFLAIVYLK